MEISRVDTKQRKKALKRIQKKYVNQARGIVKFSFYGSKTMLALAVVVGGLSAFKVSIREHYAFEFLMPLLYFVSFVSFSLLLAAIYKTAAGKDYLFRGNEKLSFDGTNYYYSYEDSLRRDSADTSRFILSKDNITKVEYDEDTKVMTLHGSIPEERYNKERLVITNEWAKLMLVDTFEDISLYEVLSA